MFQYRDSSSAKVLVVKLIEVLGITLKPDDVLDLSLVKEGSFLDSTPLESVQKKHGNRKGVCFVFQASPPKEKLTLNVCKINDSKRQCLGHVIIPVTNIPILSEDTKMITLHEIESKDGDLLELIQLPDSSGTMPPNITLRLRLYFQNIDYEDMLQARNKHESLSQILLSGRTYPVITGLMQATDMASGQILARSLVDFFHGHHQLMSLIKRYMKYEVEECKSASTLFRANSIAMKLISVYCNQAGQSYLQQTLIPLVADLCNTPMSLEVDPLKILPGEDAEVNYQNLKMVCQKFLDGILNSLSNCPPAIRQLCYYFKKIVSVKYPLQWRTSVGGFLFLRFFCPACVSPENVGVARVAQVTPLDRRNLVLVAKVLQNLSNNVKFHEDYMIDMNSFIEHNRISLDEFFESVSVNPKFLRGIDQDFVLIPNGSSFEEAEAQLVKLIDDGIEKICKFISNCEDSPVDPKELPNIIKKFRSQIITARSTSSALSSSSTPSSPSKSIRTRAITVANGEVSKTRRLSFGDDLAALLRPKRSGSVKSNASPLGHSNNNNNNNNVNTSNPISIPSINNNNNISTSPPKNKAAFPFRSSTKLSNSEPASPRTSFRLSFRNTLSLDTSSPPSSHSQDRILNDKRQDNMYLEDRLAHIVVGELLSMIQSICVRNKIKNDKDNIFVAYQPVDWLSVSLTPEFQLFELSAGEMHVCKIENHKPEDLLSLFVNFYNLMVIHLHFALGPPTSESKRKEYYTYKYCLAGENYTLNDIFYGILRGNPKGSISRHRQIRGGDRRRAYVMEKLDPRIHFAICNLMVNIPSVRVFRPTMIDQDLQIAAEEFCQLRIEFSLQRREVVLPKIFALFQGDFGKTKTDMLGYLFQFLPANKRSDLVEIISRSFTTTFRQETWAPITMKTRWVGPDGLSDTEEDLARREQKRKEEAQNAAKKGFRRSRSYSHSSPAVRKVINSAHLLQSIIEQALDSSLAIQNFLQEIRKTTMDTLNSSYLTTAVKILQGALLQLCSFTVSPDEDLQKVGENKALNKVSSRSRGASMSAKTYSEMIQAQNQKKNQSQSQTSTETQTTIDTSENRVRSTSGGGGVPEKTIESISHSPSLPSVTVLPHSSSGSPPSSSQSILTQMSNSSMAGMMTKSRYLKSVIQQPIGLTSLQYYSLLPSVRSLFVKLLDEVYYYLLVLEREIRKFVQMLENPTLVQVNEIAGLLKDIEKKLLNDVKELTLISKDIDSTQEILSDTFEGYFNTVVEKVTSSSSSTKTPQKDFLTVFLVEIEADDLSEANSRVPEIQEDIQTLENFDEIHKFMEKLSRIGSSFDETPYTNKTSHFHLSNTMSL